MSNDPWSTIAEYPDRASAEAIVGLLTAEMVPCYVLSHSPIPGLALAFSVRVPPALLPRAQEILEAARVPESELAELAMSLPRLEPPDL